MRFIQQNGGGRFGNAKRGNYLTFKKDDTSDRFELLPIPFGSRIYHTSADLLVSSSQSLREARLFTPMCISIKTGVTEAPQDFNRCKVSCQLSQIVVHASKRFINSSHFNTFPTLQHPKHS